ncbi:MAG: hypothetical protein O7H41_20750 [Planctomycetota bacterium]|nr:hypothetical protein [Planctomycetota bacterium]
MSFHIQRPVSRNLSKVFAVALLVAVSSCSNAESNKPPRQDDWVIYLHPDGWDYFDTRNVVIDAAGGKWIAHRSGVSYLDDNGTLTDVTDDAWFRHSTSGGFVYLDGMSGLWLKTDPISYLDFNGTPFDPSDDNWVDVYTTAEGLKERPHNMALDQSRGLWISYIFSGVDYLDTNGTPGDKSDDTWVNFSSGDGLGDTGAQMIAPEPGRGVWFGHYAGVSFLDFGADPLVKGDDRWVTFTTADGLVHPAVESIAIDSSGYKWFGTYNDVSCLDDAGTPFSKFDDRWMTYPIKNHPRLFNETTSIAIDLNGGKWFGTTQSGVYFLDDAGTPFDRSDDSSFYSGKSNGLASNSVFLWGRGITIDSANGKWVCTSEGLCYLP